MAHSFDLVTQPFLPCLRSPDTAVEYGLFQVLTEAHLLRELRADSPLVTAALHRLLLAVLHRCYRGPKSAKEREAIWRAKCFDADRVRAYLDRHADRFDLFHETFPFY